MNLHPEHTWLGNRTGRRMQQCVRGSQGGPWGMEEGTRDEGAKLGAGGDKAHTRSSWEEVEEG